MDVIVNQGETAKKIASMLLEIGAVKLNLEHPFVWASGWHSPIYCDNRKSLSYPEIRKFIKTSLATSVRQRFPNCEAIAGVATAGIPQGALVADYLELPFLYVRSKPKGHGLENLIEGAHEPGTKIVVIEDLVSTGGSSLKAVEALRQAGSEVLGLASIFSYEFDIAYENFEKAHLSWFSLSNYNQLVEYAVEQNIISGSQLDSLQEWRKNPGQWRVDS